MGKKLIIPGADFSQNGIVIPMSFLLEAGHSVTLHNGDVYPSSGLTEEDTWFEVSNENDVPTYNIFAVGTGAGSPYVKEAIINLKELTIQSNLLNSCSGLLKATISAKCSSEIRNMCINCSALKELNISRLETENVENINYLFQGCSSLENITFGENDFSSVKTLTGCFNDCSSLVTISGRFTGLGAATLDADMTLNLAWSSLTRESALAIISGLASNSDGHTRSIRFSNQTYALLSADDKAAITSAGWVDYYA